MAGNALKRKLCDSGGNATKKPFGHWSMGLKSSMDDPELRVDSDDKCVIIKDKYPKARYHFLILPKENIPNLKSLKPDHVLLLKHIHEKGEDLARKYETEKLKFRLGYHGIPSMSHVHMHVISQDFDSPCLKTKKHWNSFTSDYFRDSLDVIKELEETGTVQVDRSKFEDYLKQPLKCHVCKKEQKNIPTLKQHILTHLK